MADKYHIIDNPVSGIGAAPKFVEDNVVPLLNALEIPFEVWTTTGVNDAGRIGREILAQAGPGAGERKVTVVVAAGDGTAHELMDGVLGAGGEIGKWEIVVLPMGTANALHSTLFPPGAAPITVPAHLEAHLPSSPETRQALSSLILALAGSRPTRLPITLARLLDSSGSPIRTPIPSHIVLSTALHATILADSEDLRASVPGLERFKQAAAMNIGLSFPARVQLIPSSEGVKQYSPSRRDWVEPFTTETQDGKVTLDGPFAYLLTATTTARLEPMFVIVPTLASRLPGDGTMDIVVIRPQRDRRYRAAVAAGGDGVQEQIARSMEALQSAYHDGRHVRLVFPPDGGPAVDATDPQEDKDVVVETFRCKGFTWTPTQELAKAHIVCADGSLYTVPPGGSVEATVTEEGEDGFWVWG